MKVFKLLMAVILMFYRTWGTKEESEKFNYYMAFINSVSNLTYDNLEDFKEFANDPTLTSVDLVELSLKVKFF